MSGDPRPAPVAEALPELKPGPTAGPPVLNRSDLRDLPMQVEVPLGHVNIDLRGFLELENGSVVQTDRQTGEPLEIWVNGTPIARGEVRIHGERFAVRVTEILRATRSTEPGADPHAEEPPPPR